MEVKSSNTLSGSLIISSLLALCSCTEGAISALVRAEYPNTTLNKDSRAHFLQA